MNSSKIIMLNVFKLWEIETAFNKRKPFYYLKSSLRHSMIAFYKINGPLHLNRESQCSKLWITLYAYDFIFIKPNLVSVTTFK